MASHPEERRIAGLLRELIVQSGAPLESVERKLGWGDGRLRDLLDGRLRLGFEDVLEVLPLLNTTPPDFFAWLYGFEPGSSVPAGESGARRAEPGALGLMSQRSLDRRFDQSLRAVKNAVARRRQWKEERGKT
ncbi:MAG TPA: hypothetical protein VLX28_18920 [Thermoanaerobaculia bacterium]|nr:hypothetical protein [Thermoanaerobaculia bacterium]